MAQAAFRTIRPGNFETMRTALVDEVLAAKISRSQSPVGERILIRLNTLEPVEVEIIGVVRHQRGPSLAQDGLRDQALRIRARPRPVLRSS